MKILQNLRALYSEHKILYSSALLLIAASAVSDIALPYLRFLAFFVTFCAVCAVIYGLLLHFEKHCNKPFSQIAGVLRKTALSLIALFLISFITVQTMIFINIKDEDRPCEYLIVLGGGIKGTQPSMALASRLDRAITYLNDYPDSYAVLCGGQGKNEQICEADAMSRYLISHGINESRLLTDEDSYDTRQNIANAYDIIQSRCYNVNSISVAVVSNEFHLYRTKLIMQKQGFGNISTLNSPTPTVLLKVCMFLREYFSIILEVLNI